MVPYGETDCALRGRPFVCLEFSSSGPRRVCVSRSLSYIYKCINFRTVFMNNQNGCRGGGGGGSGDPEMFPGLAKIG